MKKCSKCKQSKSESEFGKNSHNKDGLVSLCKKCRKLYDSDWRKKNPELEKRIRKKYRNSHREKINEMGREYDRTHKIERQERILNRKYGIRHDIYNGMFFNQDGCCAICGKHQAELKQRLNVDHDHETGKIRGLLCGSCNMGIGYLQDAPELLMKAIEYLENNHE